jgi:hypothetical protein
MGISQEEKEERLGELADRVSAIQGSDVIVLGIWAGSSV